MSLPVPLASPVVDSMYEELHSLPIRVRMVMIIAEFYDNCFLPTYSREWSIVFPDTAENSVGATVFAVWMPMIRGSEQVLESSIIVASIRSSICKIPHVVSSVRYLLVAEDRQPVPCHH